MKATTSLLLAAMVIGLAGSMARADLASIAADLGATLNPGVAPTGIFGTVIGGNEGSGYQLTPFGGGYDFAMPSPMGAAAGDGRDFHWVHETSTFDNPARGTKWTFGGLSAVEFILDPSIDHPPIPNEGLEGTLWGSSDGGTTWEKGALVELYASGWNIASIEDQPSSRWVFSGPVSMISLTQGLSQGAYFYVDGDVEVDAVSMGVIPAPGAAFLGVLGLSLVGWVRRRSG